MSGGQFVSTGWNISGSRWTIEMNTDYGKEVFTHDVDTVDRYYLDDILQPVTPPLPTGTLVANSVALDGTTTVTRHIGDLIVRTDVVEGNLVANGDFSVGASGWVQMKEANGFGSTDGTQGWQLMSVEADIPYQFSCDYDRQGVNPSIAVKEFNETGASLIVFNPIADGWNNVAGQFTSTTGTVAVHFGNGSDTALFDNVSVTKV